MLGHSFSNGERSKSPSSRLGMEGGVVAGGVGGAGLDRASEVVEDDADSDERYRQQGEAAQRVGEAGGEFISREFGKSKAGAFAQGVFLR
jgi:hypothetical protein